MGFEEKLLEFMNDTSESLGELKALARGNREDIKGLASKCDKIPEIERGLNNHLSSHNNLKIFFLYPIATGVGLTLLLAALRFLFHLI